MNWEEIVKDNFFYDEKKVDGQDLRKILHDLAQEVPEAAENSPYLACSIF